MKVFTKKAHRSADRWLGGQVLYVELLVSSFYLSNWYKFPNPNSIKSLSSVSFTFNQFSNNSSWLWNNTMF